MLAHIRRPLMYIVVKGKGFVSNKSQGNCIHVALISTDLPQLILNGKNAVQSIGSAKLPRKGFYRIRSTTILIRQ